MPPFSLDDLMREGRVDIPRVKATTDADIARQITQDPDTAPDLGTEDDSTFAARRADLAATSAAE